MLSLNIVSFHVYVSAFWLQVSMKLIGHNSSLCQEVMVMSNQITHIHSHNIHPLPYHPFITAACSTVRLILPFTPPAYEAVLHLNKLSSQAQKDYQKDGTSTMAVSSFRHLYAEALTISCPSRPDAQYLQSFSCYQRPSSHHPPNQISI